MPRSSMKRKISTLWQVSIKKRILWQSIRLIACRLFRWAFWHNVLFVKFTRMATLSCGSRVPFSTTWRTSTPMLVYSPRAKRPAPRSTTCWTGTWAHSTRHSLKLPGQSWGLSKPRLIWKRLKRTCTRRCAFLSIILSRFVCSKREVIQNLFNIFNYNSVCFCWLIRLAFDPLNINTIFSYPG